MSCCSVLFPSGKHLYQIRDYKNGFLGSLTEGRYPADKITFRITVPFLFLFLPLVRFIYLKSHKLSDFGSVHICTCDKFVPWFRTYLVNKHQYY